MTRGLFSRAGLLVLALVALFLTIGVDHLFKGVRLDLTRVRIYAVRWHS